jgi:UDP-3-O-[3-hydroxymyristoyl] glucosamine N-acyltransferase
LVVNSRDYVIIHPGAIIADNVEIAPFTIIHPNVEILSGVKIGAGSIIGKKPVVGKNQRALLGNENATIIGKDVNIGEQCIVYAGARVEKDVYLADRSTLRENCFIDVGVVIGAGVVVSFNSKVGKNSKIMTGSNISGNMVIGKNCFIGLHVCCVNDKNPMLYSERSEHISARIGDDVLIGSKCVVYPSITISSGISVAAGSIIRKPLLEEGLYAGNPAKLIRKKRR